VSANPRRPFPDQLGLALDLPLDYYALLHHEQRGVVLHWEKQALDQRWTKLKPNDPRIPEILRLDRGRDSVVPDSPPGPSALRIGQSPSGPPRSQAATMPLRIRLRPRRRLRRSSISSTLRRA